MLEPQLIGIGPRHLERLVIALSGALAIWLGYRLFLNTPLAEKGSGKLLLPGGLSLFIPSVGPGVLFALFGLAVLAYGLHPEGLDLRRPAEPMARSISTGAPGPSFDGVFEGRRGDAAGALPTRMILRRHGDLVTGVYSYGVGQGEISGIVQDDTLSFASHSGGHHGRGQARAGPGGVEFDGTWGYHEASSGGVTWTGARRGR
jgi:hypothetical protein